MTRKKKTIIWIAVIVVLVGGFLALRIPSWNQTYGLPEDVIAGERIPTAEETIRLYFYHWNRLNDNQGDSLLTDELTKEIQIHDENYFISRILGGIKSVVKWFLEDEKIASIDTWTEESEEVDVNRAEFLVDSYSGYLWEKKGNSYLTVYELVRENTTSPWRINSFGDGSP